MHRFLVQGSFGISMVLLFLACDSGKRNNFSSMTTQQDPAAVGTNSSNVSSGAVTPVDVAQASMDSLYTALSTRLDTEVAARVQGDADLQRKIDALKVELDAFRKEVLAEIARLDKVDIEIRQSITALETRLTSVIETSLAATKTELESKFNIAINLKADELRKEAKSGLEALELKINTAIASAVTTLEGKLAAEVAKLTAQDDAMKARIASLETAKVSLEAEIAAIRKSISEKGAITDQLIADIQAKGLVTDSQIAAIKTKALVTDGQIAGLSVQDRITSAMLNALQGQLDSAQNDIIALTNQGTITAQDLLELKEKYTAEAIEVQNSLAKLNNGLVEQTLALSAFKLQAAQTYATKAALSTVQNQLANTTSALNLLQGKVDGEVMTKIVQAQSDVIKLQGSITDMKGQIAALKTTADANTAQILIQQESLLALAEDLFGSDGTGGIVGDIYDNVATVQQQVVTNDSVSAQDIQLVTALVTEWTKSMNDLMLAYGHVLGIQLAATKSGDDATALVQLSSEFQAKSYAYQTQVKSLIDQLKLKTIPQDLVDDIKTLEAGYLAAATLSGNHKTKIEALATRVKDRMNALEQKTMDQETLIAAQTARANALDKKIADLDAATKAAIQKVQEDLRKEIDAAKAEAIAHANTIVAPLGPDVTAKFEAVARQVLDLQVKQQGLAQEQKQLAQAFYAKGLTEQQEKDLAAKRQVASDGLLNFLGIAQDIKLRMVMLWNPDQKTQDFYFARFKAEVMAPYAGKEALCKIEAGAVFPNAMGLDSQDLLSMIVLQDLVSGLLNLNPRPELGNENLLANKTELERMAVIGGLDQLTAVDDPACKQKVIAWARGVINDQTQIGNPVRGTLWSVLANDAIAQGSFPQLRERLKNALNQYSASWKAFQDALAVLKPALSADEKAQVVAALLDAVFADGTLQEKQAQFDRMIKNVDTIIKNLDINQDGVIQNTEDIAKLKALYDQQVIAMNQTINNLNQNINNIVQNVVNQTLIQVQGAPAQTVKAVKDLAGLLATLAQRLGPNYNDILNGSLEVIESLSNPEDLVTQVPFTVKPFISDIQQFWSKYMYQSLQGGNFLDPTGQVIKDRYGNPISLGINGGSNYFSNYNTLDQNICYSENGIKADGAANTYGSTYGNKCWLNFRLAPLDKYRNQVAEHVIFRLFGSMEAVIVKSNNKAWAGGYNLTGKNLNDNALAKSLVASPFPAIGFQAAWGDVAPFQAATKVGEWNQAGVYDVRAPEVVQVWAGEGSFTQANVSFYPVRSSSVAPYIFALGDRKDYGIILYSPLVLDFSSKGPLYTTHPENRQVFFDLNGDGIKERTGWIQGFDGSLLGLDVNKNGKIDDGSELFGQGTVLPNGKHAENGYLALAAFDDNKDGVIDARDSVFKSLLVWSDHRLNGTTDEGELETLEQKGVTQISLKYEDTKKVNQDWEYHNGNRLRYMAKFYGPASCPASGCNSYDVYFGATQMVVAQQE